MNTHYNIERRNNSLEKYIWNLHVNPFWNFVTIVLLVIEIVLGNFTLEKSRMLRNSPNIEVLESKTKFQN